MAVEPFEGRDRCNSMGDLVYSNEEYEMSEDYSFDRELKPLPMPEKANPSTKQVAAI